MQDLEGFELEGHPCTIDLIISEYPDLFSSITDYTTILNAVLK